MSADVVCLRPEADFREVGVQPPPDLSIRFSAGPGAVPDADLATARAVVLASVGPAIDRAWADRADRVELVQFTGAGVDRATSAFTGRPGVVVANVPAANAREVAEYVLLATGSLLRGLALADREIRAGRYREVRGGLTPAAVRSLHSATVGVVGLGQIGLATARLFQAAGAQVGYSDPAPREPAAASALGLGRLGLAELLAASDVVTLHVPLVAATRGLIGEAELHRMPRGAILVNASRGGAWWTRSRWPRLWRTVTWAARSWTSTRRSRPRRNLRCSPCPPPRRTGCSTRRISRAWPARRPAACTPTRGRMSAGFWSTASHRRTASAEPDDPKRRAQGQDRSRKTSLRRIETRCLAGSGAGRKSPGAQSLRLSLAFRASPGRWVPTAQDWPRALVSCVREVEEPADPGRAASQAPEHGQGECGL